MHEFIERKRLPKQVGDYPLVSPILDIPPLTDEEKFLRDFGEHWYPSEPPKFMAYTRFRVVGDHVVYYKGCYYWYEGKPQSRDIIENSLVPWLLEVGISQVFPSIR